jgi:hypothetical protein
MVLRLIAFVLCHANVKALIVPEVAAIVVVFISHSMTYIPVAGGVNNVVADKAPVLPLNEYEPINVLPLIPAPEGAS